MTDGLPLANQTVRPLIVMLRGEVLIAIHDTPAFA